MNPIHLTDSSHTTGSGELRVFISSTFRDMQAEREQLVKHVFPELRRLCRERGVEFTEVDLRWGITEQQARQGEVVQICLDEISRHHPYIIGVIGDRYGWRPALEDLGEDDRLLDRYPWLRQAVEDRRSLVELEVMQGLLSDPMISQRAFFYFRSETGSESGRNEEEMDEERRRLAELKERIRLSGAQVREGFADVDALGELVRRDLLAVIERDHPAARSATWLEGERQGHQAFAVSRRRAYVEHPETLERLEEFCGSGFQPDHDPDRDAGATTLVITGESGSGKSALLAYWSEHYRQRHPDAFIVEHYIGATSASGDHHELLRRIMAEIKERYRLTDELPSSGERIEEEFPLWLARVQREPMILVIDALNQLDEGSQSLSWLPEYIPPGVLLLLSTLEGRTLDLLRERGCQELHITPLTHEERTEIIRRYLGDYRKELSDEQLSRIVSDNTSANPLFLRTSLEELRLFGSFEQLDEKIDYYLGAKGLEELFQRVIARIEGDYGEALVRDVMTLIWASRWGLSERELLEIIGCNRLDLLRLLLALEYHLMNRNGLLTFFHDYLRQAVEERYLDDAAARKHAHLRLARYFEGETISGRKADELPWQLQRAEAWEELEKCIVDIPMFRSLYTEEKKYELVGYWLALGDRWDMVEEYRRSLERYQTEGGYDDEEQVVLLTMLGSFFEDVGRYDEAEGTYREALALRETFSGSDHADTVTTLNELAAILSTRGKYGEAEELLARALDVCRTLFGSNSREMAKVLTSLAVLMYERRDYERAEPFARSALAIYMTIGEQNDLEMATTLSILGSILYEKATFEEAEALLRTALPIYAHLLGERHPGTAELFSNLGNILLARGDYEGATPILQQALAINETMLGPEHLKIADNLMTLGMLYKIEGKYDVAEKLYRRALAIERKRLGPEHPMVARNLISLATLIRAKGDLPNAQPLLEEALAIHRQAFGLDHIDTAMSLLNMAGYLKEKGDYNAADGLYRQGIPIRERVLGYDHPETRAALKGYIDLLRRMNRQEEASTLEQRLDSMQGTG
jgi:tetratricopeptide (TPR) repeat protein